MVKCFWGKENGGVTVDPTAAAAAAAAAAATAGVSPAPGGAQAQQYSYGYGSMSYWYPQAGYATQSYMQAGYPYPQQYQYPAGAAAGGGQQYCVMPQQGQWTGQPGQQPNGPVMYATVQKYPTQWMNRNEQFYYDLDGSNKIYASYFFNGTIYIFVYN